MAQTMAGDARLQTESAGYLRIEKVWKYYGEFAALREISLDVYKGEFICFLGPSGCGKTTLLRAIAGLDLQTNGIISQGGKDVSRLPPSERDFGIVFQSYALFPNLTARHNIAFGLENSGRKRSEVNARVSELLGLVGLSDQGEKYPAQLSGGQQQRVALARALATNPGLLLLDEPLSALDAKVRVHLRSQIKDLQRDLGVTTIMVTHDQEEALSMADRIVVMNQGVIEQVGSPTDIYRKPSSLFVADFIGEMNQIPAVAGASGQVVIGDVRMECLDHAFSEGEEILAAIRPNDIIPFSADGGAGNGAERAPSPANTVSARIGSMEFLGAFWRCHLQNEQFHGEDLIADLSVNAVRRLDVVEGSEMRFELPKDRLMVFERPGG